MSGMISDRELGKLSLRIAEPENQRGLTNTIPDGTALLGILNTYSIPEPDRAGRERVYCAVCKGRRHWNGFTGHLSNGYLILCGSKCGRDKFGMSFTQAEKAMNARLDRQYELRSLERLSLIAVPMKEALQAWMRPLKGLVGTRSAFYKLLPEVFGACSDAALREDGMLTVSVRSLDHAAMAKRGSDSGLIYRYDETVIGRLDGAGWFGVTSPIETVQQTLAAIEVCQSHHRSSSPPSTIILRRSRRDLEDAFSGVLKLPKWAEAGIEFFHDENLARVCDWLRRSRSITGVSWRGNGLTAGDARVALHDHADALDLDAVRLIQEFRRGE